MSAYNVETGKCHRAGMDRREQDTVGAAAEDLGCDRIEIALRERRIPAAVDVEGAGVQGHGEVLGVVAGFNTYFVAATGQQRCVDRALDGRVGSVGAGGERRAMPRTDPC